MDARRMTGRARGKGAAYSGMGTAAEPRELRPRTLMVGLATSPHEMAPGRNATIPGTIPGRRGHPSRVYFHDKLPNVSGSETTCTRTVKRTKQRKVVQLASEGSA